jgi:hypothetical protein
MALIYKTLFVFQERPLFFQGFRRGGGFHLLVGAPAPQAIAIAIATVAKMIFNACSCLVVVYGALK